MTYVQLAIDGGEPVRGEPLPSWPRFETDEIEAADGLSIMISTLHRYVTRPYLRLHRGSVALVVLTVSLG